MRATPPNDITLPQFSAAFIPFGLLAIAALLYPEMLQNVALDLGRTKATILVTSVMLIPALVLYPFREVSQRVANSAHLYWSFAYLLFLLHAYWAVFVIFSGVANTFKQMGTVIASVNFLLLFWWGFEAILLWTARSTSPAAARFQIATRVFTFLVFAITLVFLRGGSVRTLGIIFIAAAVLAQIVGLLVRERDDARRPLIWSLFR